MQKTNSEIVDLLRKVVIVYKIERKNFFQIAAYEKAADAIELLSEELYDTWKKGLLNTVEGLGASTQAHIVEFFEKGNCEFIDRQLEKVPSTVFLLTKIPKVGPIKAYRLVTTFKLLEENTALKKLLELCKEHKISELDGFGEQSELVMIDSIKQYLSAESSPDRIPYAYAKTVADDLVKYLKQNKLVKNVDVLGSLRRKVGTIGDIDIAVEAKEPDSEEIVKHFVAYPKKRSVDNAGAEKASIYLPPKLRVDLRVHPKKAYGTLLQYFTGSKAHNIKLREYALQRGYSLNEYGLKDLKSGDSNNKTKGKEANTIIFDTEEKLYNFLGLNYIEPEDRTGGDEIEKAKKK